MKTAIVLGGTVPHIDLICQLKERGFHTVLVDYGTNPPAKQYAAEHIIESTLDKEAVLKIAAERKADLVISTSVDQANVVCCFVAEKLGLPHPYSYETALDVTDKVRMKAIMHANGIKTSRHISVSEFSQLENAELCFPIMIKPADSNSAKGVKKVENIAEAEAAFELAKRFSRNGMVIAEEFVSGPEISAYGYVVNNEPHVIMIQERISTYDGDDKVIKCYASIAPARISEKAKENAAATLMQIADAFKLDNTPLFFQGIVKGDDISVIEFAPRTGGGISTQTMKKAADFDFISASIDSWLGLVPDFSKAHKVDRIYAVNQVYANTGVIGEINGCEDLVSGGIADIVSFYRSVHSKTDASSAGSSRVLVMVVSGDSEKQIKDKVSAAFSSIDVIDENGSSMIRKDLNLADIEFANVK
ncbi:MAG: ATP-grasp domain-containing protein [Clostridia bacterium]|nr:ATP-grasp domain-containing protein [Clostridia bacterium]